MLLWGHPLGTLASFSASGKESHWRIPRAEQKGDARWLTEQVRDTERCARDLRVGGSKEEVRCLSKLKITPSSLKVFESTFQRKAAHSQLKRGGRRRGRGGVSPHSRLWAGLLLKNGAWRGAL